MGGRASEFENAIEWASVSSNCIPGVRGIKKPLEINRDIDDSRFNVSDEQDFYAPKRDRSDDILYMVEELRTTFREAWCETM